MDAYVTAAQQLAKVMYEGAGKQGPAGPQEPGGGPSQGPQDGSDGGPRPKGAGGDDNIIDADYKVK
jgi:hypothetical protein